MSHSDSIWRHEFSIFKGHKHTAEHKMLLLCGGGIDDSGGGGDSHDFGGCGDNDDNMRSAHTHTIRI